MPTTAKTSRRCALFVLACALLLELQFTVAPPATYLAPVLYGTNAIEGVKMSRSAGGGSGAAKSQTGGSEAPQRPESGGGGGGPGWGGFPMFGPPGGFAGFHTLDRLYAEMLDNFDRVRNEMERLYLPTMAPPFLSLGAGPSSPALRTGPGMMPLALPGGGGRSAGGNSVMPYYRGGRGPSFDMMPPFYSPMFGGGAMMPFSRGFGPVVPRVDFQELENEYLVQADVPGIDKSNVKIQVHNGILHIGGEQHQEAHEQQKGYFMQERHQTSFSRSLPLPENVREDAIRATMKDGVLQVHLPKVPVDKSNIKKIHVE